MGTRVLPSIAGTLANMAVLSYRQKHIGGPIERLDLALSMYENVYGKEDARVIQCALRFNTNGKMKQFSSILGSHFE